MFCISACTSGPGATKRVAPRPGPLAPTLDPGACQSPTVTPEQHHSGTQPSTPAPMGGLPAPALPVHPCKHTHHPHVHTQTRRHTPFIDVRPFLKPCKVGMNKCPCFPDKQMAAQRDSERAWGHGWSDFAYGEFDWASHCLTLCPCDPGQVSEPPWLEAKPAGPWAVGPGRQKDSQTEKWPATPAAGNHANGHLAPRLLLSQQQLSASHWWGCACSRSSAATRPLTSQGALSEGGVRGRLAQGRLLQGELPASAPHLLACSAQSPPPRCLGVLRSLMGKPRPSGLRSQIRAHSEAERSRVSVLISPRRMVMNREVKGLS